MSGQLTLALKTDSTLACWGDSSQGQDLAHTPTGTFTQVSAGGIHTCALKTDGTVVCWGSNFFGQLNNIPSDTLTQVSAGGANTCGVTTAGRWICWGWNAFRQSVPAGTPTITTQPSALTVAPVQSATFSVVASGPDPLSYQWYFSKDGTNFTPINGATGSSYTIPTASPADAGQYKVTIASSTAEITSQAAKLTVLKGTVTITAGSPTITYGDSIPAITPSYAGFVGGDTAETALSTKPTCSTTATSSSPPGNYATSCSDAVASNYDIAYVDGTLTITDTTRICVLYEQAKANQSGSAIPIKIQLCDANGNDISSANVTVHAESVARVPDGTPQPVKAKGSANPGNNFLFDPALGPAGDYIYNLDTKGLPSGTYALQFTVAGDSQPHTVQFVIR